MDKHAMVASGLYRLIKWVEDGNPAFPSPDTVVEVKDGYVINFLTHRRCLLDAFGEERSLFGPIRNPYDGTSLRRLPRIEFVHGAEAETSEPAPRGVVASLTVGPLFR